MGLCGTKAQAAEAQTGVNDTASQPKVQGNHNRGRVRRLSLATSGGAGQGAGEVRQEDSPGHGGNNVDKRKGKRGKRMSIVSGDLGGDAGFTYDSDNLVFYDGVQIDDGNARLRNAAKGAQGLMEGVRPPRWLVMGAASRAGHDGVGRKINQDAYLVSPHFQERADQFLFGVFDGHGTEGHFVSRFVTRTLPSALDSLLPKDPATVTGLKEEVHGEALRKAVIRTEEALFQSQIDSSLSGTTAVIALLRGKDLLLAHCGDSRAVVGRRQGSKLVAAAMTEDHKPETADEKRRIEGMGGLCKQMYDPDCDEFIGPVRVWSKHFDYRGPGIAMSRSMGDQVAAEVGVISDPTVQRHVLDLSTDAMVIIASDGVWEFITDQEAVEIAAQHSTDPRAAAMALCNESLDRWHREEEVVDDITAIVLQLRADEDGATVASGSASQDNTRA